MKHPWPPLWKFPVFVLALAGVYVLYVVLMPALSIVRTFERRRMELLNLRWMLTRKL